MLPVAVVAQGGQTSKMPRGGVRQAVTVEVVTPEIDPVPAVFVTHD